jgi:hypothetical protein
LSFKTDAGLHHNVGIGKYLKNLAVRELAVEFYALS